MKDEQFIDDEGIRKSAEGSGDQSEVHHSSHKRDFIAGEKADIKEMILY